MPKGDGAVTIADSSAEKCGLSVDLSILMLHSSIMFIHLLMILLLPFCGALASEIEEGGGNSVPLILQKPIPSDLVLSQQQLPLRRTLDAERASEAQAPRKWCKCFCAGTVCCLTIAGGLIIVSGVTLGILGPDALLGLLS